MKFYLYKITNLVNNKIYVGVHKTSNVTDDYMGSGKVIRRAIQKHGVENFRKDILEFFENQELMYAKEKEMVTDEFLERDDVYNIRRGGHGGFDHIIKTKANLESPKYKEYLESDRCREKGSQVLKRLTFEDRSKRSKKIWENNREKMLELSTHKVIAMASPESARKRKESFALNNHAKGENNSQFGKRWMYSLAEQKCAKVSDSEVDQYLSSGWVCGRKMKF